MPDELEILKLRAQLRELGSTVRQLDQAGLDSAAAQLLLSRGVGGFDEPEKARCFVKLCDLSAVSVAAQRTDDAHGSTRSRLRKHQADRPQ